jgi:Domain of unknown function (DUF1840)
MLWLSHKQNYQDGGVMLVTFKSKAAAEVLMYEEHAKRILDLLHKDVKRGIITAAEMPNAIAALEAEIAESRMHPASEEVQRDALTHQGEEPKDNEHEPIEFVSFSTRAYPLLEMMRAAQRDNKDVMWGV